MESIGLYHSNNGLLVALSILISIFASFTALSLSGNILYAHRKVRLAWLVGGSLAMGIGIWSMNFVALLAFKLPDQLPEISIAYDIPRVVLSMLVAVVASAIALSIVSRESVRRASTVLGGLAMGAAIAGMHYIAIASMRMSVRVNWDWYLVGASVLIACGASFVALEFARRTRSDSRSHAYVRRLGGGVVMGFAISGMHFTAMEAMRLSFSESPLSYNGYLMASDGLALAVTVATAVVLGLALAGSVLDRTLRARQQQELALKEAIRARDEFLSIASHELKTPITSMKLQTQMRLRSLAKGDPAPFAPERLLKSLEADARQIEKLTRLIDDMLDISRISSGRLTIHVETFDLCDLVADIVERFSSHFQAAACDVRFVEPRSILGQWDKFRIEQVVTNLLTNAVRYGAGQPVEIEVRATGDSALVIVRDRGIGIKHEDQARIFDRFERASTQLAVGGLGLGLYIVKQIVIMHRGDVRVASEPGRGSEFTVQLPLV